MNVISIPLDKIVVGARLRAVDEDYAASLATHMAHHGQRTPIEVRAADRKGMFRLIAGAHRLRALQLAELGEAQAIVHSVRDDEARLMEVDENLVRRELSALDRAVFLLERKRIYEALHPETKHGGDRRGSSCHVDDLVPERFTKSTAERIGYGEITIQRAVAMAERLSDEARRLVASTYLATNGSQLDALARLEGELQVQVAREIAEAGEPVKVNDVVARLLKQPPPTEKDGFDRHLANWKRCTPAEKERIREHVTEQVRDDIIARGMARVQARRDAATGRVA